MGGGDVRGALPQRVHALVSMAAAGCALVGIVADAIGLLTGRIVLWSIGAHLVSAGVALAIPAAVAGGMVHRLLPRDRSRRRSAVHGWLTVAAVLLLAAARWVRGHPEVRPDPPIFLAEAVAGLVLVISSRRIGGADGRDVLRAGRRER